MEQTPNKGQHTKLTLEKKKSPAASAGIRTHNLSITSLALLPTSYPGFHYSYDNQVIVASYSIANENFHNRSKMFNPKRIWAGF